MQFSSHLNRSHRPAFGNKLAQSKTDASFTSEKCLYTLSHRLAKLCPHGAHDPEQRGPETGIVLDVVRAVVRTVVRAIVSVVVVVVEHPRSRQTTTNQPQLDHGNATQLIPTGLIWGQSTLSPVGKPLVAALPDGRAGLD